MVAFAPNINISLIIVKTYYRSYGSNKCVATTEKGTASRNAEPKVKRDIM